MLAPMGMFLLDALEKSNCTRPVIQCMPCKEERAFASFDPAGGIRVCENYIQSGMQVYDALSHEIIHAYDHCRVFFDMGNCRHHACSEIRAANISGECKWTREMLRGHLWPVARHHMDCVQRRARLSLQGCKACDGKIEETMSQVWDPCISDTSPFIETP